MKPGMRPAVLGSLGLFLASIAAAQQPPHRGTRADYERMNRQGQQVRNKVFRDQVKPNWFGDGSRFWYRLRTAADAWEFVLVDATRGSRQAAFQHRRLAARLSQATDQPTHADRLPLQRITFSDDGQQMYFRSHNRFWKLNRGSGELTEVPPAEFPKTETRTLDRIRPSRDGGGAVAITLVNEREEPLRVFWIDRSGNRKSHGTVQPGDSFAQNTFVGHVWLVTDLKNKPLTVFETTGEEEVIIDNETRIRIDDDRADRRGDQGVSPDGRWRAFVREHNLYLRDLHKDTGDADGEFALTTDGKASDHFRGPPLWSPDSRYLVARRVQPAASHPIHMIESSPQDQVQPRLHTMQYLKPGDRIQQVKPCLFDIAARQPVEVSDELFRNPWQIRDIRWQDDSGEFTFVFNQRGHQVLRVIGVNAKTGAARAIVDEQSETFIDYHGKYYLRRLPETGELIWMSERDGWNHLYLYDVASGQVKNRITRGEWVVRSVDRVDVASRKIYFRASGIYPDQDPYLIHYCHINLDGSGLVVMTGGNGTHSITWSPDRRYFVDTWSRVDLPPRHELRRTADGSRVCELEKADISKLLRTGWVPPEPFVAQGRDGKTDIHGVLYRPANMQPGRSYPVVEYIYAGPHDSFVPKRFFLNRPEKALAELGFVVVQIDGMGTSNRSRAFHQVCWKNLGDSGFPDRIAWMKAAGEKYPQMDLSRVGIYGGSAGGQSSTRALLAHGDFYKVAVSDCGCHDNRMDKIWWNELWMGWPPGPHYAEQSNVTNADRLTGKLFLIVGELDRNVDPASTMQVVDALVRADKDFDLLVVPGRGHGVGSGTYGMRRTRDFLVRHLIGVEPRGE